MIELGFFSVPRGEKLSDRHQSLRRYSSYRGKSRWQVLAPPALYRGCKKVILERQSGGADRARIAAGL